MKIIRNFLMSLAVVLGVSSCNLDLDPTNAITYEDASKIFDTYDDAVIFANGLNTYFRAVQQGMYWTAPEIQCDMYSADASYGNNGGPIHTMSDGFTSGDSDIEGMWNGYYAVIMQCNYFLTNILNIDTDALSSAESVALNKLKGEAIFFRAFCYHQLGTLFCDRYEASSASTQLGLPLVTSIDLTARPARSDLKTTYAYITGEVNTAIEYLTAVSASISAERPTVDAAKALAARVALWMGSYEDAITYTDAVISSRAGYTLASDADALENEFITQDGTEAIYLMYGSTSEGASSLSYYLMYYYYYSDYDIYLYYCYFYPNERILEMYDANDTRYDVFFNLGNDSYMVAADYIWDAATLPTIAKYRGNPSITIYDYHTGSTKARVFGLSEMYLIKAEAQAQLGLSGDAATTINTLQEARGASLSTGSMDDIKNEWAKETIGEGLRLSCLKRWNDGFSGRPQHSINYPYLMTGTGFDEIDIPAGYYKLTWPIPQTDMEINDNLVQNPGW